MFSQITCFLGFGEVALPVLAYLGYLIGALVPTCGIIYAIFFLLTLPLRRKERARRLLEVIELGLDDGRTPEAAIVEAAASRDRSLGARFHMLAAYIETGKSLEQALDAVPRLLPPETFAMVRVGRRLGDLKRVLPACALTFKSGSSHVRGALNYVALMAFAVTPLAAILPLLIRIKVLPAFRQVFEDMLAGSSLPAFTRFVFASNDLFFLLQLGTVCLLWAIMLAYIAGPYLRSFLGQPGTDFVGWVQVRLPWRRKRLQRDFSGMLAILLDGNVPESEAVRLAAETTANGWFMQRAEAVIHQLKEGRRLPEALRLLAPEGEFQWRLENGMRGRGSFLRALSGWHEALEAKAFQLEQSAAQITTSGLVLINGAIVGCIVIGIFIALIQLLNQAVLW